MKNLLDELVSIQDSIPQKQRSLCKYILSNCKTVYLMTVGELAEKSGVGRATIMRLVENLGYTSYTEFRHDLNRAFLTTFEADPSANPFFWPPGAPVEESEKEGDSIRACFEESLGLLQRAKNELNRAQFDRIVDLLLASRRVNTLGLRTSSPISRYVSYMLGYFLDEVRDLSENESMVYDRILALRPGELMLIIASAPMTTTSIRAAKLCHENGIPIVAIVDTEDSPLLAYTTAHLCIPRSTSSRLTILPLLFVLETVINEVGVRMAPLSVYSMNRLNQYILDQGIVSQ